MLWIIALFLVLIASFYLAWRSMRDYQERPIENIDYSLFLIQNPEALASKISDIFNLTITSQLIISFEKLLKGQGKALVCFAPRGMISKTGLKFLEIEDYLAKIPKGQFKGWEVGLNLNNNPEVFNPDLELGENDQLFFQIVTQPQKEKLFQTTLRAILVSPNQTSKETLTKKFEESLKNHPFLFKQIKPQTSEQILINYKQRNLYPPQISKMTINFDALSKLIG